MSQANAKKALPWNPSTILLAAAAFLAPLMGGFIAPDPPTPLQDVPAPLLFFNIQGATLAHAALGLLAAAALIVAVARRQIIQLPQPRVLVTLGLLVMVLLLSTGFSAYRMASMRAFCEWAVYALVFISAIACAGRAAGPKLLSGAFVAGCTLLGILGIQEYVSQPDPSWRIFAQVWQQPNSLAGMLLLGYFAALGLTLAGIRAWASGRKREKPTPMPTRALVPPILSLIASVIIGGAMVLTGSKGGLLAVAVGFIPLALLTAAYSSQRFGRAALFGLAFLVVAVGLLAVSAAFVQKLPHPSSGPPPAAQAVPATRSGQPAPEKPRIGDGAPSAPLTRVFNAGAQAEQSTEFRKNLWKSTLTLIKQNPTGSGIGTYKYVSAKPGLTPQTVLAHESYLQLAEEASPAAACLLLILLLLSAFEMVRGSKKLPAEQNLLRAGAFAALFASSFHSFIDSDLYQMGIGVGFFLLLAVGLLLSADAVVPEYLPAVGRISIAGLGAIVACFLFYAGIETYSLEAFSAAAATRSPSVMDAAEGLRSSLAGSLDNNVWYLTAFAAKSPEEVAASVRRAIDLGPTPAEYRLLARLQQQQGNLGDAISTLNTSLQMDPNNLLVLSLLVEIERQANPAEALKTAQRLVEVESKPYFTVSAEPDLIPTETYDARIYLAGATSDPAAKIKDLRPAIEGYLRYAEKTVPEIVMFSAVGATQFGSPAEAEKKLQGAITAARELAQAYHTSNDSASQGWANDAAAKLQASQASLPNTPGQ